MIEIATSLVFAHLLFSLLGAASWKSLKNWARERGARLEVVIDVGGHAPDHTARFAQPVGIGG